ISFSSSFERPRFKLRSNRKRIDNTKTIGRPMASVASTTVTSSPSGDGREWIMVPPNAGLREQHNSNAAVGTTNVGFVGFVNFPVTGNPVSQDLAKRPLCSLYVS